MSSAGPDREGLSPAGWYDDPDHPNAYRRYWDGADWTEQRRPKPPTPSGTATSLQTRDQDDEIALLADTIEPRYRTFILVKAYSGLRAGELAGLRRQRVDLLEGTVEVRGETDSHQAIRQLHTDSDRYS